MATPSPTSADVEKGTGEGGSVAGASGEVQDKPSKSAQDVTQLGSLRKLEVYMKRFEHQLVKYNVEARGAQRVEPQETHPKTWMDYLQAFFLWISINLAAVNIALGMLAPTVYALSFKDAALCAVFGSLFGSTAVAYIATWGPISGNRTMIFARYTFGWYPSKLIVLLNLIILLGYSLIDLVVAGQILSALSTNGSLPLVVGIVVVAIISWVVSTFGIKIFHMYMRYAWLPQLIAVSILYGISASQYDLQAPSMGDSRTVVGNRISFFSLCFSAAITYAGGAADFSYTTHQLHHACHSSLSHSWA